MIKQLIGTVLLITLGVYGWAQSGRLPRRVYVGIRMENLSDDSRKLMDIGDVKGVLVAEVLPKSTAENAGFRKGDILMSVNGVVVNSTAEVLSQLAGRKGGDEFVYELYRDKKKVKGKTVFQTFPEEKYADLEVIYSESETTIGQQRMIITKPRTDKKLPLVAFIGGIGCYSLDYGLDTNVNELKLLNTLSRAGFLCARLEKPGMGDNAKFCKPCKEVSFTEETNGYVQAIRVLKQRPDVDSNAVYIIGHSMGGLFAPLVAGKTAVKGIIAYGTIGSNFIEYLAKTRRTIAEAYAMTPVQTDDFIKDCLECCTYYFIEKMTSDEAGKIKNDCKEMLSTMDLRSRAYNNELYAMNVPGVWRDFTGKSLLLWGGSDYISAREDHEILQRTVNHYHPGLAEMMVIPQADHGMNTARDFKEARINPGVYNTAVTDAVLAWLRKSQGLP